MNSEGEYPLPSTQHIFDVFFTLTRKKSKNLPRLHLHQLTLIRVMRKVRRDTLHLLLSNFERFSWKFLNLSTTQPTYLSSTPLMEWEIRNKAVRKIRAKVEEKTPPLYVGIFRVVYTEKFLFFSNQPHFNLYQLTTSTNPPHWTV